MNPAPVEICARGPAQTFATVGTTSGLKALHHAIGTEQRRTSFQIVPIVEQPSGHPRFELKADSTNIGAAIDTVRSLLGSLVDAADRGLLRDFEVTRGADLLHRIPRDLVPALPPQLPPAEPAVAHSTGADA